MSGDIVMAQSFPLPVQNSDFVEPIVRPTRIVSRRTVVNTFHSTTLELELDSLEHKLFDVIVQAVDDWNNHMGEEETPPSITVDTKQRKMIQVRVAGGWVRDKVLGLQTHDVDIAIDHCSGVEFATFLKSNVEQKATTTTALSDHEMDCPAPPCGKIGVIAANPAQSKHLETATMRIFGLDVDFCNLRHETYAEDSRIPSTMIGTPLEDSYRRDFTMNALYYNLHTREVEDWTRKGLRDLLETKQVTTPLEAYQTFHDDPLRVLRAIRFGVRYDMELALELKLAAMHPQIHNELHRKVSRERVGKELEGMLSGKHANPTQALRLICDLKLAGGVFCLPTTDEFVGTIGQAHLQESPYECSNQSTDSLGELRHVAWIEARACLDCLPHLIHQLGHRNPTSSTVDIRLLHMFVLLLPYARLRYMQKKKVKHVIEYMVRDGIKFKNKDIQSMLIMADKLDEMEQLLRRVPDSSPNTRLQVGLLLRASKELWVTLLATATVRAVRTSSSPDCDSVNTTIKWYDRAQRWYDTIVSEISLDYCWRVKPLLQGTQVMELLRLSRGPEVGIFTDEVTKWMLMNPGGSLEDCKLHLKTFQKMQGLKRAQGGRHISKKAHV